MALSVRMGRGMGRDASRKNLLYLRLQVRSMIGRAGGAGLDQESGRADCEETTEGFASLR